MTGGVRDIIPHGFPQRAKQILDSARPCGTNVMGVVVGASKLYQEPGLASTRVANVASPHKKQY